MPQSLEQYARWLDNRSPLWPKVPPLRRVTAAASIKPLEGIRAVTWSVYGTLLRITDGRLMHVHPNSLRMQVALEKTIEEFNMWHSMSRKPGAPWEYMDRQYRRVVEEHQMVSAARKGDVPEVDSAAVWKTLIGRLIKNGYCWDESFFGDLDSYSLKVAYYFHMRLQGVEASEHAAATLSDVAEAVEVQGLLGDGQPFTLVQLLRGLEGQSKLPARTGLFAPQSVTLSYEVGVRTPSPSLFEAGVRRLRALGIGPNETLYVGCRLRDELQPARRLGMRTALYAGDAESLQADKNDLRNPRLRPDRLLTDLSQLRQVLQV